jgi:hypothetical protein
MRPVSLYCIMLCIAFVFSCPDALRAATFMIRRTDLYIWQIFDSVTISINTHLTMALSLGYV